MDRDELIEVYDKCFINRHDLWAAQWGNSDGDSGYIYYKPDMNTCNDRYEYEPVTLDLIGAHLVSFVTCAWTAIDEDGRSKWICFDSDTANGDLDKLEAFLQSCGLYVIREGRRPGRDGHLWVLLDQPVAAKLLIPLSDAMMKYAGVTGLERFPKSAKNLSQVRGPLGINRKLEAKGARGWFDGAPCEITAQLEWLAEQPLNNSKEVIRESEKIVQLSQQAKKPPVHNVSHRRPQASSNPNFNILEYVDYRARGRELIAQCPLCAAEGHDHHQDNLRIQPGGSLFCCVYGGPNQVHQSRDIKHYLLRGGQAVNSFPQNQIEE